MMFHLHKFSPEKSIRLRSIVHSFVARLIGDFDRVFDCDFEDYLFYHPLLKVKRMRNEQGKAVLPVSFGINRKFLNSLAKRSSKSTAVSTIFTVAAAAVLVGELCRCLAISLRTQHDQN